MRSPTVASWAVIFREPLFVRLWFVAGLSPSTALYMIGNPVDGGLRKGTCEKRPILRSRFAQSPRTYCAKGITSKLLMRRARPELRTRFQGLQDLFPA